MNTQSNSSKVIVVFLVLSVLMVVFGKVTTSQAGGNTGSKQPAEAVSILTPSQQVEVLGRAVGSNWLAIPSQAGGRNSVAYVFGADVKIKQESTGTYSPVNTYLHPNQISFVIDILFPNQKVYVIGRSADGKWLAVENADTGQFRGWVWAGDIRGVKEYADAPVIPIQ